MTTAIIVVMVFVVCCCKGVLFGTMCVLVLGSARFGFRRVVVRAAITSLQGPGRE